MISSNKLLTIETIVILVCLALSAYFIHHSFALKSKLDEKTLEYENLLSEKLEIEKSILQSVSVPNMTNSEKNTNSVAKSKQSNISPAQKDSIEHVILKNEIEVLELSKKITILKNQLEQARGFETRQ
ncbi:MAG: hypothetical protein WCL00_06275 [Bacteroidota bacterium]